MRSEGLTPDAVTFISILQACGSMRDMNLGRQIHEEIVSLGLLEKDIALGNALLDMYAKCGALPKAQQVLQKLRIRDTISWNAIISGYAQQDGFQEVLACFECMKWEGISPDTVTFICMLKASGSMGALGMGKEIHEKVIRCRMLDKDIVVGNALVDMYAKCGMLAKAQQVLEELPIRDVVSWNALIAGYAQLGRCQEAFDCLDWMQMEGVSPNSITFVSIIKACGGSGALDKGIQVHEEIRTRGLLATDIVFGNALVDMYAKCGVLTKAQEVLEEIPLRDLVAWSALIAGYAQQGQGLEALSCFQRMQSEGFSPDDITFLSVLTACNHAGLLDEAQSFFWNMSREFGIRPSLEHHTSMVAVFGSAGQWDKAMSVIKSMPSLDHPAVWLALLDACRKWGNVKLGKLSFDHVVRAHPSCPTAYVLMINIFAAAGMHEDVERVRFMRLKYALTSG
jgi:pentatricopeptide repeat protein